MTLATLDTGASFCGINILWPDNLSFMTEDKKNPKRIILMCKDSENHFYRSYYKGHKDKIKGEGGGRGGRWDWLEWGGGKGRKCRQL